MQNHTKVYFKHFNYAGDEFIACECCGARANDIHHIVARGMGGVANNRLDIIENLQAVCRTCHNKYGDKAEWLEFLVKKHAYALKTNFDNLLKKIQSL